MQDPNEDTEWNDVLRAKGILPPKRAEAEISEEQIQAMVDAAIKQRTDVATDTKVANNLDEMTIDELDELEDSEDEGVIEMYRRQRIAELLTLARKAKYGSVREISGQDYVDEVTKAGEGVWVVLHLYANGVPQCALIHQHMQMLAERYPQTKFMRSVAKTCIPDFPDRNTPAIFVYFEGQLRRQLIGAAQLRGDRLTEDELEFLLGEAGAVPTTITEDPRPQLRDTMLADLNRQSYSLL